MNIERSSSPGESEPRDMTANLNAYWGDCHFLANSPTNVLAGFERLVREELRLSEDEAQGFSRALITDERSDILPSTTLYEHSQREAMEYFALAPLKWLGPVMEREYEYTPDEIELWYDKAIKVALALTTKHTNDECLADLKRDNCDKSENCPRKVIRALLLGPILNYQFDTAEYIFDPERYTSLAEAKVQLAIDNGLITHDQAVNMANAHHERRISHNQMRPDETE